MKYIVYSMIYCVLFLFQSTVFAAEHPDGNITFYNASDKNVTAQVSSYGKVVLAANSQKNIPYSTLAQACSATPTNCTAQFYVDDAPAGRATINSVTGKLINMKLNSMKVNTSKSQQVLRSVVINSL